MSEQHQQGRAPSQSTPGLDGPPRQLVSELLVEGRTPGMLRDWNIFFTRGGGLTVTEGQLYTKLKPTVSQKLGDELS